MKLTSCIIVLILVIGTVTSLSALDVDHQKAVEDAIAEAENEEQLPVVEEDNSPVPAADESDPAAAESEPPTDDEPPADEQPEPAADSTDPLPDEKNLDVPVSDPVYPEGEILSLPHLPDPKYDEDGDVQWFPRIIGGDRAREGEFPSKVSLQSRSRAHFCGGSLINSNHILSAAHCVVSENGFVVNPTSIEIMAGDISISREPGPHRVHRIVSHIFAHPEYSSITMLNDVAVLRVSIPFHNVDRVLHPEPLALEVPITGTTCTLAGWGATSEGSQVAAPNLMRVNLEIVDTTRCNASYQGLIQENMFCAGTMKGGRDACQGDSGGGLMCNGAITGIVSFGFGCGRPRFPGVYMDVAAYYEFIQNALLFVGSHDEIPTPPPGAAVSVNGFGAPIVLLLVAVISYVV